MRACKVALPWQRILMATVLLVGSPAGAQTLEDVQDDLRRSLRAAKFASSFAGLVYLADDLELSGANYAADDEYNSRLAVLALPFHRSYEAFGPRAPRLYVEGVVGCSVLEQSVADVYDGGLPGMETSADAEYRTWGGLVGLGPELRPSEELRVVPLLNLGLAHVESDADYGGPGAAFTASLLNGIALNWDAGLVTTGVAVRADWRRSPGPEREVSFLARYDLRWTETFATDDPAQEFRTRIQLVTLRGDVAGPTRWRPYGRPLGWRVQVGYRGLVEGELLDTDYLVQLGGALEQDLGERWRIGSRLSLSAAVVLGEDVVGWTAGLGLGS